MPVPLTEPSADAQAHTPWAIDLLVFVEKIAPLSAAAWQQPYDAQGIPVKIDPQVALVDPSGVGVGVPVVVQGHPARFDLAYGPTEILRRSSLVTRHSLKQYHGVYVFHVDLADWDTKAAVGAAACLAMALNGRVIDPVENRELNAKDLAKVAGIRRH